MPYSAISAGSLPATDGRLIIGSGTADHIHLLASIGRIDAGELIGDIKRNSSLWIKKQVVQYGSFYYGRA